MIQKIISSGGPGAGRGAIDAAVALDIPFGGKMSDGFSVEDFHPDDAPGLAEIMIDQKGDYIKENIMASDGTLVIINGVLSGESDVARRETLKRQKSCLLVDLGSTGSFQASQLVHEWLETQDINILYVVGASASESRKIQKTVQHMIEATYYLCLIESNMISPSQWQYPYENIDTTSTVEEAIGDIVAAMPLKDRVTVANYSEPELEKLWPSLGTYIQRKLSERLHPMLTHDSVPNSETTPDAETSKNEQELIMLMIRKIWKTLQKTHKLRLVK